MEGVRLLRDKQVVAFSTKPNPKRERKNLIRTSLSPLHILRALEEGTPSLNLGKILRANKKKSEHSAAVQVWKIFLKESHISRFSGRDCDLEDDHIDTLPSENTSEIPVEPESLGPPPELIPVRSSSGGIKGCTQANGIYTRRPFPPVADIRAIRILISSHSSILIVMRFANVMLKTAFLNGSLLDETSILSNLKASISPMEINDFEEEIKGLDLFKSWMTMWIIAKASGSDGSIVLNPIYVAFAQKLVSVSTDIREAPTGLLLNISKMIQSLRRDMSWLSMSEHRLKSKKQTTMRCHATQSEYMAASEAAMEAFGLGSFISIFANEPGVMKGQTFSA
ncbi:hypothetical protein Tco_1556121 [Tanacetum coccineum]